MTIIQQPESLSLSRNIKSFRIGSDEEFSFVLKQGTEEILSQTYNPGIGGVAEIDLRDIVHGRLSFDFKDATLPYQQQKLVGTFTAYIDNQAVIFRVIRGGVDRLSDSATNFLTQNFLTWQPTVKPVTYYSPEYLTYYAVMTGKVQLKAYFTDNTGAISSTQTITLTEVVGSVAYTIPVQYSIIVGKLSDKKPSYYDVWVENDSGERLTYIQRYFVGNALSLNEDWLLFENSLGGLDCFRAYGSSTLKAEHTHNIAQIEEESLEYRIDTERKFEKNTGHLTREEARWLLDFFPSPKKYIYTGDYVRPIVVTESNVSGNIREQPANYTFTYKYADGQPLLNLPRTDVPATMLDIVIPEVGNFTVPPRLSEVPRLSLSEGALFPVQNPYNEEWSTTTARGIADFIANVLTNLYGATGGVGHLHRNYSLLELLSYVEGYLLVDGKKINAGYADKAGGIVDDVYIRKDRDDFTRFLLTLFKGVIIGKDGFASGLTGFGAKIDENGDGEMENLFLRRSLTVPLLNYNRVDISMGDKWRAPGAGIIDTVDVENKTCTLKLEEGETGTLRAGDICMGIYHSMNSEDNATEDTDDSRGNRKFAGFCTVYFTITEVIGERNEQFRYQVRPVSERWTTTFEPFEQMTFVAYGSFTDETRQTSVYETRTYTRMLWKQNTWEISAGNIALQYGDLSNLNIHGMDMQGYSMYLNNVYFTGTILQTKPDGTPILTANDRGAWASGHYDYYDRVSHNGCIWLCVNESGTDSEPAEGNADWLLQVKKGEPGEDGLSASNVGDWHSGLFVPYLGITRMGGASWQCTATGGTTNPPLWTITDKDGNRLLQTQDGGKTYGYILTGEENTAEYKLVARDGTDGLDGVGIPGKDGKTFYTWIRYADDEHGGGMSNDPSGKTYIGLAANRETPTESDDPADYIWSLIKGEDGVGVPGKDGKTYYIWIAYSDNADGSGMYQQPNENTRYIGIAVNKESPNESNNPGDYTWSRFKGDTGPKGDSVSNVGDWHSGLFVPYLGITRMAGSSWQCTATGGTTNPPLWTITDKDGNRLLQTQDGGKTYGYILTGEKNTAEYVLIAEDGIKGDDGLPGCILRHAEWSAGTEYRNDENLSSGTRYLDVALVRDNNTATGWRAYKCKVTHTSSAANAPGNTTYWEEFGMNTTSLFTGLIIAKNALIEFMSGNQLLIKKDDGTVTIGLTGDYGGKAYIWAGGTNPGNARFSVDEEGNANVDGNITAATMRLKMNTAADGELSNGYLTTKPNITLPSLQPGECMEIKMIVPLMTKVMLGYSFRGADSHVRIALEGDMMAIKNQFEAQAGGGSYFNLIGMNNPDLDEYTVWHVFPMNRNAEGVIDMMVNTN